ncbi:MAG: hypothetical protein ROO76_03605 [Terriglobia bacterium]|jgi:hypothetical protein|nr:hypothetical protein [Terriglobia bacterium]
MKSRRELIAAKAQIEELLRSISLTPEQRDHYLRELEELNLRLGKDTFSRDASTAATSD